MSNLENICCPICNTEGTLKIILDETLQDEPYLHLLPAKVFCDNCGVEFSKIVLNNNKVEDFSIENYEKAYNSLRTEFKKLQTAYKSLNERFNIVYDDLMYIGVYQCPKCGHYTMEDYVCHECGYDKTEGGFHE